MWRKNSDQQTLYFWFFSKCCFTYSNKQCLSCWWQLNYFIPEHFDKWFSEFWFLRILITPKKHELNLYVICLIYLRCVYYVAKAIRRELKDRVIHSIFMIISFFTVSLQEKKYSEIQSKQGIQTFFANKSGLWFLQIVGAISLWLHWNPQNWTCSWCREPELLPWCLAAAVGELSHAGSLAMHRGTMGCNVARLLSNSEGERSISGSTFLPRNAWFSSHTHSYILPSEITQMCKLLFALIPNWSADQMFKAKFVLSVLGIRYCPVLDCFFLSAFIKAEKRWGTPRSFLGS